MTDDIFPVYDDEFELGLSEDRELAQPPKDVAHLWIGWLTLACVLVVLGWIILGGYVSLKMFLLLVVPIGAFVVVLGWIPWLIERGNRHPD